MKELKKYAKEYNYDPQITRITMFPQQKTEINYFFVQSATFLGTLFILLYVYTSSWQIYEIFSEKEKKLKEGMCIMGLNELSLFWSWLIVHFVQTAISGAIASIIMYLFSFYNIIRTFLLRYSNGFYLFLLFILYGFALVSFTYLVSTFFSKSKIAIIACVLLTFVFFFVAVFFSIL